MAITTDLEAALVEQRAMIDAIAGTIAQVHLVNPLEDRLDPDKWLGPRYEYYYPEPEEFPVIWERPLVPVVLNTCCRQRFSEGLGTETDNPYDFAGTEGQLVFKPDRPFNPSLPYDIGLGVDRVRTNESAGGVVTAAPQCPWNTGCEPDPDIIYWWEHFPREMGVPIACARAHLLQVSCGLVLFDNGFVATANTVTGHAWTGGIQLPAHKKPLSITLTSQNEFALVGVHDTQTGKGEMCVISLWGDGHLMHDWPVPHPGLMNAAIWAGMKILGYVDLGIKWPTNLSAVGEANLAKDRIEDETGNAGLLYNWNLDLPANRAAFLEHNSEWISRWGHCVVISKYENKAVFVDMTSLFAAMRAQYFTTQEAYEETKTPEWPYTFDSKPLWRPSVVATIEVPAPTAVLVSEAGSAQAAIACMDGTVRFYTRDAVLDGSVWVGENPTCLAYSKYKGTIRTNAFLAASRGARQIVWVDKFRSITKVLRDSKLLDPVWVEVQDTHGIEMEQIAVCDYAGRKLETYRSSVLEFITQGLPSVPVHDGAAFESNPSFPVDGFPFIFVSSNVN